MLDGRLGGPGPCSVARCQATVTLPLRCATRDSTPAHHAHDGAPCLKVPREVKQAHAPAQSLPSCHAIPSHPPHRPSRTTPIQTDRPSPASNRVRKRSAVPTRFSGARKCTQSGPPPASQPSPPLPSLAVNWRGQEPRHLGAQARPPPIPIRGPGWTTHHRPSHPLPSNAANWQRAGHIEIAPPGTYPGTSKAAAPTTPPPSYPGTSPQTGCPPGPPSRPQRQRPTPGPSSQLAKGLGR